MLDIMGLCTDNMLGWSVRDILAQCFPFHIFGLLYGPIILRRGEDVLIIRTSCALGDVIDTSSCF